MKNKRKLNKLMPIVLVLTMTFCLIACGNTSSPAVGEDVVSTESTVPPSGVDATTETEIEKELPDSMDASEVADMLESGMTVDQVIDRVEEEIKGSNAPSTDKPTETASPTQTAKPTATPSPTASPEPTPTPTPEHVHEYVETVTRQATCAEAGEKQLVCECGNAKVENVPATGQHNWVENTTVVHHEALGHVSVTETQVQVGVGETRHEYECKNCGARFNTPEEKVEHCKATGDRNHATCGTIIHDIPGEPVYETRTETVWVVDQEAWDESVGNGVFTCSVCGAIK